jgi:hypothetical protein
MIARLFAAAHLTVHAASDARSQPITYAPPPLPAAAAGTLPGAEGADGSDARCG